MKEPNNRNDSSDYLNFEGIDILFQCDRDEVILILKNRGYNHEKVFIQYQKTLASGTETYRVVPLTIGEECQIELPSTFREYFKFDCRVGSKKQDLKELLNRAITQSQSAVIRTQDSSNESESEPKMTSPEETESGKETDNTRLHVTPEFQQEDKTNPTKQEQRIESEESTQDDDLNDIVESITSETNPDGSTIPEQIAQTIRNWITELEQSELSNKDVIQTLRYSEQEFRKLLNTKAECNPEDSEEYDQFIIDRLFNGVVRFIQSERLPKQLRKCLELAGFEVVPIEVGKTQADARIHDIQVSRKTGSEYGTVVEILIPGLRRITDGEIIQKPVVIRGE